MRSTVHFQSLFLAATLLAMPDAARAEDAPVATDAPASPAPAEDAPTPAAPVADQTPAPAPAPAPQPLLGLPNDAVPAADIPMPGEPPRFHNVGLGSGVFFPTEGGETPKFALEATVPMLRADWVPANGLLFALDHSTGFDVGSVHFRCHWINFGAFINTAKPVTRSDYARSWDLMAGTGVEFTVWNRLAVKGMVDWFFPNPFDVYQTEKRRVIDDMNAAYDSAKEACTSGMANAGSAVTCGTNGLKQADNAVDAGNEALRRTGDLYGTVAKRPVIGITARWEF